MRRLDRKDIQLRVRVSPNEQKTLDIMAQREGRSLSDMLRECIREAAERRKIAAIGLVSVLGDKAIQGN